MMTRRASATTQGEVQGFASAIMALGSLITPLIYNPALAWFTSPDAPFIFHGIALVIAAVFGGVALLVLMRIKPANLPDPAIL
jgi:DHA1 family tetracycline resistance protein-like MFS transporter